MFSVWSWREIPCPRMARGHPDLWAHVAGQLPGSFCSRFSFCRPWSLGKRTEHVAFVTRHISLHGKLPFSGVRHVDELSSRVTLGQKYLNLKIFSKWLIKCVQVQLLLAAMCCGSWSVGVYLFLWFASIQRGCICLTLFPPWEAKRPLDHWAATSEKWWVWLGTLELHGWRSRQCWSSWGGWAQAGQQWAQEKALVFLCTDHGNQPWRRLDSTYHRWPVLPLLHSGRPRAGFTNLIRHVSQDSWQTWRWLRH